MGCGEFCAGQADFDFKHPGYCGACWDEIEEQADDEFFEWLDAEDPNEDDPNDYNDAYDDEEFPNGSLDY
ncbi:hypothetical protein [Paraflavitalea speifideaquila]|uniref:hypothetical protein n=1 Tax=Paraflavitalea speifideaquila TaxID=3076558 RepID=UPI0028E25E44|nr:hypothetical protein [Paraflavitalea speifideiaquila]